MAGYYFEPIMSSYNLIICRHTKHLMSEQGRKEIAILIKYCRRKYGKHRAKDLRLALIRVGAIYP